MDDKKEKLNLVRIVCDSILTAVIGSLVTIAFQWFSVESAIVSISPSAEINGQYLTIVSVHNLKEKTLSDLSLYFEPDVDILKIESKDSFELQQQYVKLDSLAPKAKYGVAVWTTQEIKKDHVIAESEYKTQLDYANEDSPFMVQLLKRTVLFWGAMFLIIFGENLYIQNKNAKNYQKMVDLHNEAHEKVKSQEKLIQQIQEDLKKAKEESDQSINEAEARIMKENQELRSYYTVRIAQLSKELAFWRDTIRKLLYDGQKEFQTADKVIETVTVTLKTYTTREHNDDKMDETLYLAQLIADSRELHDIRDS